MGEIRKLVDTMLATNEAFAVDLRDGDQALEGGADSLVFAATSLRLAYNLRKRDYLAQQEPGSPANTAETHSAEKLQAYQNQMGRFYSLAKEAAVPRGSRLLTHMEAEFGAPPAHPLLWEAHDRTTTAIYYAHSTVHSVELTNQRMKAAETLSPEIMEITAEELTICRGGIVTALENKEEADQFLIQYRETL